ncbi:MAG: hypothetical protein Q9163_004044 [Psora crenata]
MSPNNSEKGAQSFVALLEPQDIQSIGGCVVSGCVVTPSPSSAADRFMGQRSQCFSSLERLRIARTSPASSNGPTLASTLSAVSSRLNLTTRKTTSDSKDPPFRRPRPGSAQTAHTFSPSDCQWYQRLPAKIQRRHFTEGERVALSGTHCETFIPDAADWRLYELSKSLEVNRSLPTLYTSSTHSHRSSLGSLDAAAAADDDDDNGMEHSMMDAFQCLDNDDDLDLASTLDDYHQFYAHETLKQQTPSQHPSFRKVMSLSSIPFVSTAPHPRPPSKSANTAGRIPQQAITPITTSFTSSTHNFPPRQVPAHKANLSTGSLEPNATHYQDPTTRLKLRVFLSPQKFDEAIEFGFPSTEDSNTGSLCRSSLQSQHRYHANLPGRSFLHDSVPSVFDALSVSDSSDDEVQSPPERGSPFTPSDPHFNDTYLNSPSTASQHSRISLHHSSFTQPPKPTRRQDPSDHFLQALPGGNREMTLRMTLTRPDLRADEQAIYDGSTIDPLALEHLPELGERRGGLWDSLPPVKESGLKRIWRKFAARGY